MKKRFIIIILFCLSAFFLHSCSSSRTVQDPNILVIIIDTLRADHCSCYGYDAIRTEHIDRLAQEGMIFTEAVCQAPLTFPSHCSIFTGRYPTAHGVRHNGLFQLNQDEITLADVLREDGFETAAFVGSYVLNPGFGLEQGFDTYDGVTVDARQQKFMQKLIQAERDAEKVNEAFFQWLTKRGEKRFFAWVHYYDPHFPYNPPARTSKALQGTGYDREVSYADQCLGDLMAKLEQMSLLDNTIVLFASDHGEALGEHGENGHGLFIYDNVIRIPLILRAPWIVRGGRTFKGLFETVDIMPTILGLAGVTIPASVQGKNFAPEILGKKPQAGKDASYAETYLPMLEFGWSELTSIRKAGKKYIDAPLPELYDLVKDPAEETNLYSASHEESGEMRDALSALISRITSEGADPFKVQHLDEDKIEILKSLGYLSGSYFKGGEIGHEKERLDPKVGIEERNLFGKGTMLVSRGRLKEAVEVFRDILRKNPKSYQTRMTLIQILAAKKDLDAAIREAENASKIAELDHTALIAFGPDFWNIYASLLDAKNDTRAAINAYRRGIEVNPNKKIAFTHLVNFYIAKKDFRSAISLLEEFLHDDPHNVDALRALGDIYLSLEEFDKARAKYEYALSLNPRDADAAEALERIEQRSPSR